MHTHEKERRWRTLVADTFWTVFQRSMKVFAQQGGDYLEFLGKHLKVMAMFITILVTAAASHWLAGWLTGLDPSFKPTAMLINALGYVCLLIDGLWLTNVVVPWVPALKRWINRQTPRNGA